MPEDRAEFERVLDEALRSARLGNGAGRTTAVRQVRRAALEARPQLTAPATDEYHRYVRLREQLRAGAGQPAGRERSGGGNLAVVSVLIPVLAGVAAVVFLLVGYLMGLSGNEAAVGRSMRDIGWLFALFAAFGLLLAVAGLVITAARNGSASAIRAGEQDAGRGRLAGDVAEAREDWRRALAERGIAPFVRQAVASHGTGGAGDGAGEGAAAGRVAPQRRFSSPEFSSPTGGAPRTTPRVGHPEYSRPEFSSPEFSTQRGEDPAPSKGYAAPDYASPERSGGASRGYSTGRYTAGDFSAGDYTAGDYARPGFDSSSSSSGGGEGEGEGEGGERRAKGYAAPDFGSPGYAGPHRKDEAAGGAGGEENRS
ncbi:hypothetical protein ACFV5N_06340 [Streptomyces sp. NPDC059853]|uniref:hypothetical protein n=1 Tax=Streptomyces sp. NPDC059853 TaxID=3346973 RepID=UPI0036646F0A